jgi:hypothetical protein
MKRPLAAMTVALVMIALASVATAAPAFQTFGNTVEGPAGTFTITDFGGVFLKSKSQSAKDGTGLSFVSSGDVAGGAPRFSIPIDTSGDSTREGYAFLDAAGCGAAVGDNPGGSPTTVSTDSATCAVNYLSVDYANWTAFLAANPTARVAPANTPFIIADAPGTGTYVVSDIVLR